MPLDRYDRYVAGGRGSARKALRGMKATYGPEKGEKVFYAWLSDRKRAGKGPRMSPVFRGSRRR